MADIAKTFIGPTVKLVVDAANLWIKQQGFREMDFYVDGGLDLCLSVIVRAKVVGELHQISWTDDFNEWAYKNMGTRAMCRVNGKPYYFGELF